MKNKKIYTVTPYSSRNFSFNDLPFIPESLRPPTNLFTISTLSEVVYCAFDWISIKVEQINLDRCEDITPQKMDYITRGKVKKYRLGKYEFKVVTEKNKGKVIIKVEINPRQFYIFSDFKKFIMKITKSPETAKLLRLDVCVFLRADLFRVEWLRGCIGYEGRWYGEEYPSGEPKLIRHGGGYFETVIIGKGNTRLSLYSKRTKALYELKDVVPIPNTIALELQFKSGWLKKNDILTICHLENLDIKQIMSEISFTNVWDLPRELPAKDLNLFYSFFMNCMAYGYQQARQNFYSWNRNSYDKLNAVVEELKVGKDKKSLHSLIKSKMQSDFNGWFVGKPRAVPFDLKSEPLPIMDTIFEKGRRNNE